MPRPRAHSGPGRLKRQVGRGKACCRRAGTPSRAARSHKERQKAGQSNHPAESRVLPTKITQDVPGTSCTGAPRPKDKKAGLLEPRSSSAGLPAWPGPALAIAARLGSTAERQERPRLPEPPSWPARRSAPRHRPSLHLNLPAKRGIRNEVAQTWMDLATWHGGLIRKALARLPQQLPHPISVHLSSWQ